MGNDLELLWHPPLPWSRVVFDQGVVTKDVVYAEYPGSGTHEDPYVVNFIDNDPRNPKTWPDWIKWSIVQLVALETFAVSFASSSYTGGIKEVIAEFNTSAEVATLGLSLFVLGFAIGPLVWAPLSELYGRRYVLLGTYAAFTIFNAATCASQNIQTLVILRLLAGSIGASPFGNAGGRISDLFDAKQRGLALVSFAIAPFLGPCLGPIVGGFIGETVGWRWIEGVTAFFTGAYWIVALLLMPETYAPVLLRRRAERLTKLSGGRRQYQSKLDVEKSQLSKAQVFKTAMSRPFNLLFREPIVLLLSIYVAIVYGTLYLFFAAFPIVYQEKRGWSPGIGGLPFLGVALGMFAAAAFAVWDDRRYRKILGFRGSAPPETRLVICCVGGIACPIGLFWFAWTATPSIQFMVPIMAGVPFGFGLITVFLGILNYLIDAYTIYSASALAANSVLRSIFAAAFPLFTTKMYRNLGIHWASSVPAFLALACVPFPFLFYKYGAKIRQKCHYAAEAEKIMQMLRQKAIAAAAASRQANGVQTNGITSKRERETEKGLSGRDEEDLHGPPRVPSPDSFHDAASTITDVS